MKEKKLVEAIKQYIERSTWELNEEKAKSKFMKEKSYNIWWNGSQISLDTVKIIHLILTVFALQKWAVLFFIQKFDIYLEKQIFENNIKSTSQ